MSSKLLAAFEDFIDAVAAETSQAPREIALDGAAFDAFAMALAIDRPDVAWTAAPRQAACITLDGPVAVVRRLGP